MLQRSGKVKPPRPSIFMEETKFLADSIASLYGTVKRARGTFLYTANGQRLTDLYAEGGRAILGWGGSPAVTVFKDVLARGICGSFRTDWDYRLDKAVSELLGFEARAYAFARSEEAFEAARDLCPEATISVWRPWAKEPDRSMGAPVIIEPPCPLAGSISLLAIRKEENAEPQPTKSIHLPAPLQAAIARSLYDAIKAEKERGEKDFFIYDRVLTRYWKREGPWLSPKIPRNRYRDFVLHCLKCTLVISPCYEKDSIVPFGADQGVFRALERQPFDF